MKYLKALKVTEFTDNKLYYYKKPTGLLASRFYGQPKFPIHPIVYKGSPLKVPNTQLTFLTFMLKMKITAPRILTR